MKPAFRFPAFALFAFLVSTASSPAMDLYWDADGSAGGNCGGGAGTWDTASALWNTNDCAGTYFNWANSTTNTAIFPGSAAYIVTLSGSMTANKITNATTLATTTLGLTLTASQITMGGTTPTVHTANKLAMNSILKGSVTLTKTGAGQLQLNNNGQTISKYIIKGGIISTANTNKWGTGVGAAQDAVTLDGGGIGNDSTSQTYSYWGITLGAGGGSVGLFSAVSTMTLNTKITGTGALSFGGGAASTAGYSAAGIFILGNVANDYSGNTTLSKGTLKLGASGVLPDASAVTLSSGTTLDFNGFDETIRSLAGGTASTGGTISLGANTLTLNRTSGTTSFPGVISGSGDLIKNGAATQHLIGNNSYSGKTTINAGVLGIIADGSLGTAPGSPVADQLRFGGGTLLSSNSFTLDANRGITLAGNGTWNIADASEVTYAGIITGTGNFTKSGMDTSTLVLSGVNNYIGNTTVSGGTLKLNNANAIPSTAVAVNGSTNKLDLNNFDIKVSGLSGSGTVTSLGGSPGSVQITNGILAAGTSPTANVVGLLTVNTTLAATDSTNRWELGTLTDDADGVAGVDFDQVQLTTGELTLTNCVLSIDFTNPAVAPDFATPFWQTSHKWTVLKMVSPGANSALANFVSVKTNAYIYAGSFSTAVEPDGSISLNFVPAGPTAPIIFTHPTSKNGIQGSNVTFSVTATGTAPLSYQWYFGPTLIPSGTTSTLTVTNAQPADGGNYHVTVANNVNTATSSNATLTIIFPPVLTTQPTNQTVNLGATATFSVVASGTSPFSYQWKKNGSNISTATNTSYSILSVTTNDAASYSVLVTNIAGTVLSSNAVLTVNVTPAAPPQLSLKITNSSAILSWSSESGRIYRPQSKLDLSATNWANIPPDITASGTNSAITNSTTGTTNQFYRVLALP